MYKFFLIYGCIGCMHSIDLYKKIYTSLYTAAYRIDACKKIYKSLYTWLAGCIGCMHSIDLHIKENI